MFDIQVGFDVKFILGDRGLLFVRPVGFSIPIVPAAVSSVVSFNYDLLFGGGVTF